MFFTLLFGNKWIIALSICAEIVCHGELHYSNLASFNFFFTCVGEECREKKTRQSTEFKGSSVASDTNWQFYCTI